MKASAILYFSLIFVSGWGFGSTQNINARFSGHIPDQCGEDPSFCLIYCQSVDAGTVRARCGQDKVSCVCVNNNGHAIGVRFVTEREPIPYSATVTTPIPPMIPPPSTSPFLTTAPPPPEPANFDHEPNEPVPILLECDGTPYATEKCHKFCVQEILAYHGECEVPSLTCRCDGVNPAQTQEAPIAVIFHDEDPINQQQPPTNVPVPAQIPLVHQQGMMWTPIAEGHPNYHYPGGNFLGTQQQQQQPMVPPSYMSPPTLGNNWAYNYPYYNNPFVYPQAYIPASQQGPQDQQTGYANANNNIPLTNYFTNIPPQLPSTLMEVSSPVPTTLIEEQGSSSTDGRMMSMVVETATSISGNNEEIIMPAEN